MPNTSSTTPTATNANVMPTHTERTTTATNTAQVKLYTILANGEPIVNNDGLIIAYAEPIALLIINQLEAVTQDITYRLEYSQTAEANKDSNSMPVVYIDSWDDTPTPAPNIKLQPVFSIHHNGKPLTTSGVTERVAEHIINHLEVIGSRDDVFTTEYIGSSEVKPVLNPANLYCVYRHDKPIYTHETRSLLVDNGEYIPAVIYLNKATAYHVMEHLETLTDDIKHTRDGKTGSSYSVVSVNGGNV